MNVKGLFICILLSGMLTSCSQQRAWTTEDSWYNPPPSESPLYWTWPELDRTRIYEVTESKEPDAERLLQDASIVALTDQEAIELIGKALPDAPGTKPYLTRGLYLNRGTGRFSVYILEDQLVVHHGSLGSSPVPMKRQALVIQLEQSPVEVFVTCSMAE
jgi:hypothetical protein